MKVSVVVPYAKSLGGAFNYTKKLISALLSSNNIDKVTVVTTARNKLELIYLDDGQGKLKFSLYRETNPLLKRVAEYFGFIPKVSRSALIAVQKSESNVVIYTTPWNEGFHVPVQKKICITHDLFHYKNDSFDTFLLGQRERGRKTLEMLHFADWVVCESEYTKALIENLLLEFGMGEKSIEVISLPPGFSPCDENDGTPFTGKDCDYWLVPSHIFPFKNQMVVVRALAYLKRNSGRIEKVVFTFPAFSISYLSELLYTAFLAGVRKQITFRYKASDAEMVRLYKGCKGVILPTRVGPTNMPAIEAIEFGKRFIAANGSTDLWKHGIKYGQFVADDFATLANLMIEAKPEWVAEIQDLPSSRFRDCWVRKLNLLKTSADSVNCLNSQSNDSREPDV